MSENILEVMLGIIEKDLLEVDRLLDYHNRKKRDLIQERLILQKTKREILANVGDEYAEETKAQSTQGSLDSIS